MNRKILIVNYIPVLFRRIILSGQRSTKITMNHNGHDVVIFVVHRDLCALLYYLKTFFASYFQGLFEKFISSFLHALDGFLYIYIRQNAYTMVSASIMLPYSHTRP
jgi:hypothetical protein